MLPAFLPLICPLRGSASREEEASGRTVTDLPDWEYHLLDDATELAGRWPAAHRPDNFWLDSATLAFLMRRPQGMYTHGLRLTNRRDDRQVLLTAQTFYFSAARQVSEAAKGTTSRYDLRRSLLAPFSFKVLCLGQFLTSGDYCQDGLGQLSATEAATLLPALTDCLLADECGYAAVLLKDLYPADHPAVPGLREAGFHSLPVDPVMQVDLAPAWKEPEDYLAALSSKYRVRYRRARGKLAGLERRPLAPPAVRRHADRLYALYRGTSAGADFNAAQLTPDYFPWLAEARTPQPAPRMQLAGRFPFHASSVLLPDRPDVPRLHGYFTADDRLVGFTSAIPNGPVLHAHYLGLEDDYKFSHHLYHNMLFDLLEDAIGGGFATLDYGRTALEIKSSVGATARDFACQLRARNGLLNRLVPLFTPAVYRATRWTPRSPFRG